MSEPEIKFVVDEYGRIGYRVTNEGVLLSKDEKEFIASHILHLQAENEKLRKLCADTYDCICEMYRYMDGGYAYEDAEADPAYGPILRRMRELGIEESA